MSLPKKLMTLHGARHVPCRPPGNSRPPEPGILQPKMATTSEMKKQPVAPPVYRPQPGPTVQPKIVITAQNRNQPVTLPVYRSHPMPKVLQTKMALGQSQAGPAPRHPVAPPVYRPQRLPKVLQTKMPTPHQATKLYPNLHPGAAVPVDRSNIFSLDSFADQYRLHRVDSHGVNVPNMKYNFVRTREGATLMHNRYRHPSIAEGQQVLYAGEIFFNNGQLQWWSNGSGHYQPDADGAEQANLPLDYFFSYQQIIKGEHTWKKG